MPTTKAKPKPEAAAAGSVIRDRIKELRRVPASELQENDKNWRLHPYAQRLAVAEAVGNVGIADALIGYESKRNGGKLTLIDGHLRRDEFGDQVEWPVLVLDVTDEEADFLLLTLDPTVSMAEADAEALLALLADAQGPGTPALEDLLRLLTVQADESAGVAFTDLNALGEGDGPPEMELQAFEHYDYVMLLFRNAMDWQRAKELLRIQDEGFTLRDGVTRKIGLGRVVDGRRLFDLLPEPEAE